MNKLEELRKAAVQARANWQWDELRRIEAAIAAEDGSLVLAAQTLPDPPSGSAAPDGWGSPAQVAPEAEETASDSDDSDKPKAAKSGRSRRGR